MLVDSFNCGVAQQLTRIFPGRIVISCNLDGGVPFFESVGCSNYLLVKGLVKLALYPSDIGKNIFITFDIFNSHRPAHRG